MTATTPGRTMTLQEYLALDDERYRHAELVDGTLVEVNPPTLLHQRMARKLATALQQATPVGYEVLQEAGWATRPGSWVREPDLLVVPSELVDAAASLLEEAPLLVVEILSPDSGVRDLVEKREEYASAGLEHYLVASPAPASLTCFRRSRTASCARSATSRGRTPWPCLRRSLPGSPSCLGS